MKKIKSFKLFAGIALFVEALMLITVIIVLSIQKKSIPKALIAALAAGSVLSAWLLISYKRDEDRMKKLREMDAFYDYDYDLAYNGLDGEGEDDEDYGLGFDDNVKLIPDIDD
jgi:hypothetical protein